MNARNLSAVSVSFVAGEALEGKCSKVAESEGMPGGWDGRRAEVRGTNWGAGRSGIKQ